MNTSKRYDSQKWYAIHTYSGYEEKVAEHPPARRSRST
jgi:transcription antitermination factor NusG